MFGNAPLSKTTSNALSVLKAIGKDNIPVHPGSGRPFSRNVKYAPGIHGESGLDGTNLLPQPERAPLKHCNAIKDMRDALMSSPPQTAWLVATGTLTNVALMFSVFPEVAKHIKGLSIMGGAVGGGFTDVYMGPEYTDSTGQKHARTGNMSPFAEFNILCDPEAARSVFTNPDLTPKTSLITLDLTHQVCATTEIRDMLLFSTNKQEPPTRLRRMFYELLMFFARTYEEVFGLKDGPPLHDPLAIAIVLASVDGDFRSLFDDTKHERWKVEIITEGEQAGRTQIVPAAEGVYIPRSVDLQQFWNTIEDCMARADHATGYAR